MPRDTLPRRYFDNAATSHPKPSGVARAVQRYFDEIHASAGRGAYREAVASGHVLDGGRDALRRLFGCSPADHVIFSLNGTDALNLAIKSVLRPGDHAVTTDMDHNSVLRPLAALAGRDNVAWTSVKADLRTTRVCPDDIVAALRPNTRLVAVNHASNVTGVIQPIDVIAETCRERGILFLVDAAQTAGHVPLDFGALPVDLLAFPGHKGLLGPLGTGALLIRAGVEEHMQTVREGGTGSESERPVQPDALPDRFEAGSHNAIGIAGLLAGVEWILERGVEQLRAHEVQLCGRMQEGLAACHDVRVFGPTDLDHRVGVFSVRVDGFEPAEISALFEQRFGVLSRSGLHCAPLAHQTIGTLDDGGTTRLSFGPFLTDADVDVALAALAELARGTVPACGARAVPVS